MLRAVTNRDFTMLRQSLKSLFGMELDYDPSLKPKGNNPIKRFFYGQLSHDPQDRVRIIFIDNEDVSPGWRDDVTVTGVNIPYRKLTFIGVPEVFEPVSEECFGRSSLDAYLLVVTLHELYELFTGDFGHCDNPGRCINSECGVYDVGTCSACMGALVDEKFPGLTLEDLYCPEHLRKLKLALKKWN
ncbi:MAG TPA: hypothetical protein VMC84_02155 [Methanocella sp.]|uniref:hypothetical protein n=1 Tax=Methanocella sp. TaxID=2052833 RepID=UPI002BDC1EFF|nr:hypothetical protein [Methanocella sp.]HTY89956.1 hypothetical protein [Methanocella sp.]